MIKAKQEHGEQGALAAWDAVYHAQAIIYMHLLNLSRHYLTCATPGGRHTVSVRTHADSATAETLLAKAHRIITSPEPPARISDRPDWYQCQWCNHRDLCHQTTGPRVPQVNCRTCAHATPELDGDGRWSCARYATDLPADVQRRGAECVQHVFIPALLPWVAVDADEVAGSIIYQGEFQEHQFINGPGGWHSTQIATNPALFADPVAGQIQKAFDASLAP